MSILYESCMKCPEQANPETLNKLVAVTGTMGSNCKWVWAFFEMMKKVLELSSGDGFRTL